MCATKHCCARLQKVAMKYFSAARCGLSNLICSSDGIFQSPGPLGCIASIACRRILGSNAVFWQLGLRQMQVGNEGRLCTAGVVLHTLLVSLHDCC